MIKFVVAGCVLAALASAATMLLWNALLPALFGLARISFWQALGLLVLARLLFGGLRGPMGGPMGAAWRQKMQERWQQMTPEQRERMRAGWAGRWPGCGPGWEGPGEGSGEGKGAERGAGAPGANDAPTRGPTA